MFRYAEDAKDRDSDHAGLEARSRHLLPAPCGFICLIRFVRVILELCLRGRSWKQRLLMDLDLWSWFVAGQA